jgi:hypothetical protein
LINLSQYVIEALRKDQDFILYRGQSKLGSIQDSKSVEPLTEQLGRKFGSVMEGNRLFETLLSQKAAEFSGVAG